MIAGSDCGFGTFAGFGTVDQKLLMPNWPVFLRGPKKFRNGTRDIEWSECHV